MDLSTEDIDQPWLIVDQTRLEMRWKYSEEEDTTFVV